MKSVIETLMERRSVRRYERQPLTAEQERLIRDAIRNTPTSYNGQQFSVIEIDDQPLKERLYELTNQKQIKTCARFYLFCIDYHKISVAARAKGLNMPEFTRTADGLVVGTIDASMALMSAIVAAEACGLGTCPIGYARTAAPEAFARELRLPKGVFVVCGLAVGVPREMPDVKPKQPENLLIFRNGYPERDLAPELLQYDADIVRFNQTRAGNRSDNDWVAHILTYYEEAMRFEELKALLQRGFAVEK